MKKKTLSILSLCIALFAAFALVGCGGNASAGAAAHPRARARKRPPSPRRPTLSGLRSRCPRRRRKRLRRQECRQGPAHLPRRRERLGRSLYPRLEKAMTAEESHADQAEKKGDTFQWKDGGSVEYNGRTWLVGTFEDNSGISTMLFTDVEREASTSSSRTSTSTRKKPRRSSTPSSSPMTWQRQFPRRAKSRFRASSSSNGTPARAYAHLRTCAPLKQRAPNPGEGRQASALPSFGPAHIATCRRKSGPQNGTHGPP